MPCRTIRKTNIAHHFVLVCFASVRLICRSFDSFSSRAYCCIRLRRAFHNLLRPVVQETVLTCKTQVLGLIAALVGGRPGMVSGAAGVVVVPLAPMIAAHGVSYVMPTMLLVAAIEMMVSVLKLGRFVNVVSDSVLKGFLNGERNVLI